MTDKEAQRNPLGLANPYEQLVQGMSDYAILMLDAEGHVVTWNRGAERLKGYAPAEIIGRHFSVFYPQEAIDRRWPQQELKMAAESGRLQEEGWRVRKDGSRFWADVIITAMRDDTGALRGFSKVTRDLTERRRQEESIRQSEERFRLLVEGVKDYAIYLLDPEGRIASWNAGAERIKGYQSQEIIGKHFSTFYPDEAISKKWPEQELAMAREHGRFEDEGLRVRKDGSTFWANVTVTPLYDRQGLLVGYAKVTRDLTDRKRVEALEKAERQTNEFLAMLAHELRNPLAPISNALHLLTRKPPADPTEQWVREVLQRQTGQMTRLVDDLLDVSRITRSAILLRKDMVDLRTVVRTAVDASMQWLQARGQHLSLDVPQDQPLLVVGDEARLSQVIQNLLHNAAKYTPEGGRVTVIARREEQEAVLIVKDTGIGMEADLLQSAFQLFKQGQQALNRPQGGLGVGLTLVQRLVLLHGGKVEARSAGPDQGSELIIRLPVADAKPGQATAPAKESGPGAAPRRVLVIDDNHDAANALRLLLENDGHEVKVANDGITGLALAREYKPDYLLLDIGLPRLNGYDIAASVRSDPTLQRATIVAITGYGQVHDRARTAAVGFDHHLTKPVDFKTLQALFRAKA
ncbi:MAG TPA: PAS domain S-box protein [Burkholderiales bacterium]|nr:PAS domain S-box protein [Burkholderiales bacterium]